MPTPIAVLGARPHEPFLDDGGNPVGGVKRLEATNMNDLVLDRDQSGLEQLGQDAATACRLEGAQHQAAAGMASEEIHHRLQVTFLGPREGGRLAGDQNPTAPKRMDAGDH
jgi:hypothetical protein